MHTKNIAFISLGLAVLVAAIFFLFPEASRFTFFRFLYAPAVLLTVLLSDSIHSPSVASIWVYLVIFTLVYWFIFGAIFAFVRELVMIRQSFHWLSDEEDQGLHKKAGTKESPPQELLHPPMGHPPDDHLSQTEVQPYNAPDVQAYNALKVQAFKAPNVKEEIKKHLEQFGKALKEIEGRRRQSFFLQNIDVLNLEEPDEVLAKHAISKVANERSVKALLKRMESKLAAKMDSPEAAKNFVEMLKQEAYNSEATSMDAPSK